MRKCLIAFCFCMMSVSAFSEVTKVQGKVTNVWFFASNWSTYNAADVGLAAIYIDSEDLLPGCGEGGSERVVISTDHPLYDSVVSFALVAKTTGATVELWHLDTCSQRSNSWDFAVIRFIE